MRKLWCWFDYSTFYKVYRHFNRHYKSLASFGQKKVYFVIRGCSVTAQAAGGVEYAHCISAEGQDPTNQYPGSDTKPSDGEAPVLELCLMWSNPYLPLLPGPLWPGKVVLVRVPSIGQAELVSCIWHHTSLLLAIRYCLSNINKILPLSSISIPTKFGCYT